MGEKSELLLPLGSRGEGITREGHEGTFEGNSLLYLHRGFGSTWVYSLFKTH